MNSNRIGDDRLYVNGNNWNDNNNSYAFGIALATKTEKTFSFRGAQEPLAHYLFKKVVLETYNMKNSNLYDKIISFENLIIAWKKTRKGKTKKKYVIDFEKEIFCNLMALHYELKYLTYIPRPLKSFIVRDPKTRLIHKSEFRDRIVHHALVNILEPIFDRTFIYDSYANRKRKGILIAVKRLHSFIREVSLNNSRNCYYLKADIYHYFNEVNKEILIQIIKSKIKDEKLINLIEKINANFGMQREREYRFDLQKGMPLGNLTSQFFANVYLNELDYFIKHKLKAKYYLRYVDDFILIHHSKEQLIEWKENIGTFLQDALDLELHPDKSKIYPISHGIDFVGFRNFCHFRLLRKRNIKKIFRKLVRFEKCEFSYREMTEIFQGWQAYSKWGNTYKLRRKVAKEIQQIKKSSLKINVSKYL